MEWGVCVWDPVLLWKAVKGGRVLAGEVLQPDMVRSDPIVFLLKTFSDSSHKGGIQMLDPRPWGPVPDLPPTFLSTPTSILRPSNSELQAIVN